MKPEFKIEVRIDLDNPGRFFIYKPQVYRIDRSVTLQEMRDMARADHEAIRVIESGEARPGRPA